MAKPGDTIPSGLLNELFSIIDKVEDDAEAARRLDALCATHCEHAAALHRTFEMARRFDAVRTRLEPAEDTPGRFASPDEPVQSTSTEARKQRLEARPPLDLARYRIEGEVAKGGMGAIFRVRDADLGRRLAMKVVLGEVGDEGALGAGETPVLDPQVVERFLDEAQVTGQLDHPGVVPVHDLGLDQDGRAYFTMRLVRGRTVGEVFKLARDEQDGWTQTRALEVVLKICDTMAYAHAKGVLHRDLKPANVMVGRYGEVYVMDWGLAKVTGQADRRDLRFRPASTASMSRVRTDRAMDAESDPDSPLLTMDGAVVGTPSYMPPEQAEGRVEELGPPADVYAVGAMLYELLTGWQPYVKPGARLSPYTVLRHVMDGPPKPMHAIDATVPAELVAICDKAMARETAARYADMDALSDDLRAYLEQRVVSAYRTGALVELKMWMRRNRSLAASLAAVFLVAAVGVVVATSFAREANDRATKIERQKGEIQQTAAALRVRTDEFDRLAQLVYLEKAIEAERALYPAWPGQVEAMRAWQRDHAEQLVAAMEQLVETVCNLEAQALPQSDAEREADRRGHPRFEELESIQAKLASWRRAQAVRDGAALSLPELPAALRDKTAAELNAVARRPVWGKEPFALAVLQAALAKVDDGDASVARYTLQNNLAWAYFWNGQDAAALAASRKARKLARRMHASVRQQFEESAQHLAQRVEAVTAEQGPVAIAALKEDLAALEAEVDQRQTWRFELRAQEFLHGALSDAIADVTAFERQQVAGVVERLAWAERIESLTRYHPNARVTWTAAAAALAKADGVVASSLYRAHPVTDLEPQWGLVPIGMNPQTKLWEFYELRSAWDGRSDPAALPVPEHRPDGSIEVTGETGIVFVLLPGGTFLMGSQDTDPEAPNYDALREGDEALHEVALAPFFLARHELTKGQWKRLSGGEAPSWYPIGGTDSGDPEAIGYAHPVEQVDWRMSERLLRDHGLVLPTEAQWEYGCRGGSSTAWWPGKDAADLAGCANVLDLAGARSHPQWGRQEGDFDDGWVILSPVGAYRANGYGLYDVHGNVFEWCLDEVRTGNGVRLRGDGSPLRFFRGGSFLCPARGARSAVRNHNVPARLSADMARRPARARR